MKQRARPQQVIDRLAERWVKASKSTAHCRLGSEPRRRRLGGCSACTSPQEFELDRTIAQLIDSAAFTRAGVCPYQTVASHLFAGLTLGPEVSRARSAGQLRTDPVAEIKGILKRIRTLLYATGLSRDDIEAISIRNDGARWQALYAIVAAERLLMKALDLFRAQIPAKAPSVRGRTGALQIQAVARASALAWRQLTGRLPAKGNIKFQGLLKAALTSIFGDSVKEPNLESATKIAVDRIRKDAAGRS